MVKDERTMCRICWDALNKKVKATHVMPRHTDGNDDEPAEWVPTCTRHIEDWYEDVPPHEMLPPFKLDKGWL